MSAKHTQVQLRQSRAGRSACSLLLALCAGCAGSDVKVSGPWQPANRLGNTPRAIAPAPAVQFIATPVDRTLRTLLARWARESNRALDFQLANDFSLTDDAASIRAASVEAALESLNRIYAGSDVQIALVSGVIVASPRLAAQPTAHTPPKRKTKRRGSP